ncbi:MAG: hypothetical protein ACLGXA_10325 [Acidobacteriota bacterium]
MSEQQKPNPSLPLHMRPSVYATRPTRFTLFLRTFLPWQIVRFVVINLKMMKMIRLNERAH